MGECPCEDRDALLATLDTLILYCGSGREAQYKSLQNSKAVGSNPTFHSKNVQSNQLLVYPDDEKRRDVRRVVPV